MNAMNAMNEMNESIEYIDRATAQELLSPADAVEALRRTLLAGYRPERDHARVADPLARGEFLLMPSETDAAVGVKVLTVAPGNPARGLQRIQGLYILFDAQTLAPTRLIDGPALTDLRTAAVSLAAVRDPLLRDDGSLDVVVYGAGHQAEAHVRTLRAVLDGRREIASVACVVRSPDRVSADRIAADADDSRSGADRAHAGPPFTEVLRSGSAEAEAATARAGLILCATTARTPLFRGGLVRDDAIVVAVGSHEPDARELDAELMGRADVVVEERDVALRECGDVVMAVAAGALRAEELIPLADYLTGTATVRGGRPLVFKSAGMPWEDLVIAEAIADARDQRVRA